MATTQVSTSYILKAIDNLEKYIVYIKPAKKDGFDRREAEYNDKRKYISWLVDDYADTLKGLRDNSDTYGYAWRESHKANALKKLIEKSEDGKIMLDDDEVGMLESFLNLKTGE